MRKLTAFLLAVTLVFATSVIVYAEVMLSTMQRHVAISHFWCDCHFHIINIDVDIPDGFFDSIPYVHVVYENYILSFRVTEPITPDNYQMHFANIVSTTGRMLVDVADGIPGIPRDWEDFTTDLLHFVVNYFIGTGVHGAPPGVAVLHYPTIVDGVQMHFGGSRSDWDDGTHAQAIALSRMIYYSFALAPIGALGGVKLYKKQRKSLG